MKSLWAAATITGVPAGIHLISSETVEILQHRLMHQAASAVPVICRQRLRQHRDESEIVVRLLPASRQFRQIEIGFGAGTQ